MRSSPFLLFLTPVFAAACAGGAGGPDRAVRVVPLEAQPPQSFHEVIVEGGRIVDGSGNAWYYGDVAVDGDRITRIAPPGSFRDVLAGTRIDARGLVVAPGFIDIQSHSRGAFLTGDGRVVSKVTQGITTEILGEGATNAPLNERILETVDEDDEDAEDQYAPAFMGSRGFDAWLRAMESHGISPNVGSFVGASTMRVYGMGEEMGPATDPALSAMREALDHAMRDGAFGLASALIYPPGNFADTDEIVALAEVIAPYGGVYITHMRSEADRLLEAIDEAMEIGRRSGAPVEIYHLKAAGRRNWHKAALAVAKIDSARAAGLDVQANMYPYVAGGTGLTACFPPWASAGGALFDNLADPAQRARIREEIERQTSDWENLCALATPEGVLLLGLDEEENRQYRGRTLADVAAALGKDWIETAMDLVLSERQRIGTIYFLMSEENVALQMRQPWIKFGTDAGGFDPATAEDLAHPRAYGTYPRILGRYVRDEGVIGLEDAVRKMSGAVATRLGIRERGMLVEGFYADLVVFDPATIADRATFEDPHQLSVGMRHVLVNGVPVVRDGRHTGATPGRVVRGPGWRGWSAGPGR